MNIVRAMLSKKKILKYFWAEAVNWSNHVLNRCPNSALKDITLEEACSGLRPSFGHFWVFGCIAHVHVPEVQRTKADDRSNTCIFLGVSDEIKGGYRLFNPITKIFIISRDVMFEEAK